jgi:cytochrome P450
VFADPERFDIGRSPNPQLGFGAGIHFCLGAPLARAETAVALGAVLDRLPDLAAADPDVVPPRRAGILRGVASLPVTFTPSAI